MLMQFRLGYDLGLVLTKGIICSMLTVFLLMPGLIMLFHKALLKTRHKNLVPNITGWGRLLSKKVPVFLISLKAGGTGLNLRQNANTHFRIPKRTGLRFRSRTE